MSSWPLQTNRQVSLPPERFRSIGVQTELTVPATGENVVARSAVCSGVRLLELSCGGPMTPPVSVRVMTRHSPGAMPSANAVAEISARVVANNITRKFTALAPSTTQTQLRLCLSYET